MPLRPEARHDLLPAIDLKAHTGERWRSEESRGQNRVLVIGDGPEDLEETLARPDFKECLPMFEALAADVTAVSSARVGKNRRAAGRMGVPFAVLSDRKRALARELGLVDEATGRVEPAVVIVDRDDRVQRVFRCLDRDVRPGDVLRALKSLDDAEAWDAQDEIPF